MEVRPSMMRLQVAQNDGFRFGVHRAQTIVKNEDARSAAKWRGRWKCAAFDLR